jgi:ABC-type polysaccharide/polyol phosphate export permease
VLAEMIVLAAGLSMLVAATQVYFRDLANFLPYLLRVWLYVSPVLYYASEVPDNYRFLLYLNPLGPMLTAWSEALNQGITPGAEWLLLGLAWALVAFVVGGLFFVSRERDFAVRV